MNASTQIRGCGLSWGGVLEQDMAAKLEREVTSVEADRHWVLVIVTDDGTAVGTVALWDHEWEGETIDGIGWMVLPEHQGHGLAGAADWRHPRTSASSRSPR